MPYTFDFFVAALKDPVTGRITEPDTSTNMTTYLRDERELANLGVGDELVIDPERVRTGDYSGYLTVHPVAAGQPIRILQGWECPFCDTPFHWAEIVVRDNVIESIADVPFIRFTLERSNLVSDEIVSVAAALTGREITTLIGENLVAVVRQALESGAKL